MNIKKISTITLVILSALLMVPGNIMAFPFVPPPTFPSPSPNWDISFTWDGENIADGLSYEFIFGDEKYATYSWPENIQGQIYGEIYKGELNNATLVSSRLLNPLASTNTATSTNDWQSEGNYFVVIYEKPDCGTGAEGDFCFVPSVEDIQKWFENGFGLRTFAPYNWGIINFIVTEQLQNNPPIFSYSDEGGYASDTTSEGINPNKGTVEKTEMIFKIVYTDYDNDTPSEMNVIIGDGASTSTLKMLPDISATPTLTDGDYTDGEQYVATSTFPKGKYQYWFESSDGTNTIRLPATTTLAFETGYSNVVFLPGLKASRLYKEGSIFENQLWEPNTDADVEKLFLNSDGNSIYTDIYTRDIIDQANLIPSDILSPLRQNFYESFKNNMDELKNDGLINDWKALAYDWRLDYDDLLESGTVVGAKGNEENVSYLSATTSPYIVQEIQRLAETSANGKVTIVAHSNGGLLAKKLIDKLETKDKANLIENLILVASPQLGTPKAIASLLHGYKEDIPKDFGFFSSRATAREFGKNLISGYNLLPSSLYMSRVKDVDENDIVQNSTTVIEFDQSLDRLNETINFRDFWGSAITTLDSIYNYRDYYGDEITTAQKLNEFLRGAEGRVEPAFGELEYPMKLSTSHLESASNTHEALDVWQVPQDSGIKVIQIAGWGLDTIRGIKYVSKDKQVCLDDLSFCDILPVLDIEPLFTSDGDGIVVTPSATVMSTSTYYVDISNYNKWFTKNREHASILEIDSILTLIKNIVKNESADNIDYIYNSKPQLGPDDTNLRLALHSPVSINIYDSFGNHTGIALDETSGTKYLEEQIPNSYYMEFGEGKYIGLGTSDEYRIELRGEDFGTFTFEIQEVFGDKVLNSASYVNIPVSPTSKAELTIQNLNEAPKLSLDVDGDGTTDVILGANVDDNILASIKVLKNLIKDLDIDKKFKKHILKKLKKIEKEIKRGKNEKAVKYLDKIIKKLKKEIKKNLRVDSDYEGHKDKHDDDEKEDKEKKHKKKKDYDYDNEKKDKHKYKKDKKEHHNKHDDKKEKISTENAWMLISIIEDVKVLLVK